MDNEYLVYKDRGFVLDILSYPTELRTLSVLRICGAQDSTPLDTAAEAVVTDSCNPVSSRRMRCWRDETEHNLTLIGAPPDNSSLISSQGIDGMNRIVLSRVTVLAS